MAKKKLFLILFALSASFAVLASNMTHTAAPNLVMDVSNDRASGAPIRVFIPDQVITAPAVPPSMATNAAMQTPFSIPVTQTSVDVVTVNGEDPPTVEANTAAERENEILPVPEAVVAEPEHRNVEAATETRSRVSFGGQDLESEWIDVPQTAAPQMIAKIIAASVPAEALLHVAALKTANTIASGLTSIFGGPTDLAKAAADPVVIVPAASDTASHLSRSPFAGVAGANRIANGEAETLSARVIETGQPIADPIANLRNHVAVFGGKAASAEVDHAFGANPILESLGSPNIVDHSATRGDADSTLSVRNMFQTTAMRFPTVASLKEQFVAMNFDRTDSNLVAKQYFAEPPLLPLPEFVPAVNTDDHLAGVQPGMFDLSERDRSDLGGILAVADRTAGTLHSDSVYALSSIPVGHSTDIEASKRFPTFATAPVFSTSVALVDTTAVPFTFRDAPGPVAAAIFTKETAVAVSPVPSTHNSANSPVVIGSALSFSKNLIGPLSKATADVATVETESAPLPRAGGPSADNADTAKVVSDSRTSLPSAAKLPVLISGKTEFSADLLKPMHPNQNASSQLTIPKTSASSPASKSQVAPGYCDPTFVGEPIRFSQTVELKMEDLLSQLHARFGVNFIMGPNIGKLPINVKAGSIPWNVLLRSQLFISGVRARCIDANTVELIENSLLPNLQDSDGVVTRFVKLKFLQRTGGGTVDLANRSQGGQNGGQGGCGGGVGGGQGGGEIASGGGGGGLGGGRSGQTAASQGSSRFDQLVQEIEKILGLRAMNGGGGAGAGEGSEERRTDRFVTQIPGRNILAIRATQDEHDLIAQIIERADRPPFQVVIKGLVYSANQDRIRDIGVNVTASNTGGRTQGGIFGDTLGVGTLFDFSTIIGTFDFNVQATAFQQNGVISVKSRPFATVLDGLCTTLSVGTKLPIVIDSTLGGQGGITILNADNLLAVTPYVVDDENGNPIAVTLDLNLQANVIDSSITARGVPAVNSKNIQTQLLLGPDKTAILGGFSIDQDSKTISKVPGLGDIPIIGELFKRRIQDQRLSRLYFAISAEVIPYPKAIEPVKVPGATTDPQTITEEMKKRAEAGEQKPADPNAPYKKKDN